MDAWAAPRRAESSAPTRPERRRHQPARHPCPYALHALRELLDLLDAAIHTGPRAEAAAHAAAARGCRLDRLSPRLRLAVLAGEAITEPRTDTAALEQRFPRSGEISPVSVFKSPLGHPNRGNSRTTGIA